MLVRAGTPSFPGDAIPSKGCRQRSPTGQDVRNGVRARARRQNAGCPGLSPKRGSPPQGSLLLRPGCGWGVRGDGAGKPPTVLLGILGWIFVGVGWAGRMLGDPWAPRADESGSVAGSCQRGLALAFPCRWCRGNREQPTRPVTWDNAGWSQQVPISGRFPHRLHLCAAVLLEGEPGRSPACVLHTKKEAFQSFISILLLACRTRCLECFRAPITS